MTISPSDSTIHGASFAHPAVATAFSDEQALEQMLRVEGALARVLGRLGLIPGDSAERIVRAASDLEIDMEALREGTERAGVPVAELVRQLRAQAGPDAANHVHHGATTQDILDTARVLQVRQALHPIREDLPRLITALAEQADRYRGRVMAGRTYLQHALPITFGYKVATWLAPLLRQRARLAELEPRLFVVQLGGAAGTLAAYRDQGPRILQGLAEELDLGVPLLPWHSQRDGFAELAGWLSLLSGALARMAQDIVLLAQSEVAEVREAADPDRGGSSAMPQKRNPVKSGQILAAARANAGLLATMHHALVSEHERGTHSLSLEWLSLPQMLALASSALARAVFLAEHLQLDGQRMQENLESSRGTILAEAVRDALAAHMPRDEAEALVKDACRTALEEGRSLVSVVKHRTNATLDWDRLEDPGRYLGSCNVFIDRVLEEARRA